MDFVSVRELRSASAKVWERLEAGEDLVVTRNGKPFALLVRTAPADIAEKLNALHASDFAGYEAIHNPWA